MSSIAVRLISAAAFLALLPSCGLHQDKADKPSLDVRRVEMRNVDLGYLLPTTLPEGVAYSGGDNQTMGAIFAADGDTLWFRSVNPDESVANRRSMTLGFFAIRQPFAPADGEPVAKGRVSALNQPYVITRRKGENSLTGFLPAQPVPGRVGLFLKGDVSFAEGISLEEAHRTMASFEKP